MTSEEMDRVLSDEPDIVPSSGFVAAVMEVVTTEAVSPPLPFPWKRAWPLAAGFAALLMWMAFLPVGPEATTPGPDIYEWFETIAPMAAEWVAGGLLTTVVVTVWSLHLVRFR
jgi:hypothetical protein